MSRGGSPIFGLTIVPTRGLSGLLRAFLNPGMPNLGPLNARSMPRGNVEFPRGMLRAFKGPKFGIPGLRNALKRPDKPLVGTIVKPKIGLPPRDMADFVYEAGMGGLTNSKDDETLSNQRLSLIHISEPT